MRTLFAKSALLPNGWASDVEIDIAESGDIAAVRTGVTNSAAPQLQGAVLPGMPNLHSHAHQRAMVGLAEKAGQSQDSFWTWREAMYAYLGKMQPQQLQAVAAQLYVEMLKFGYTNVAEFQYLHHDQNGNPYANRAEMTLRCLQAARDAGIGITLLPVLYRYAGFGGQAPVPGQKRFLNDADGFLEIVDELQKAVAEDSNAVVGIAPHSLRAVTPELLNHVLASFSTGPVHIHIAEQIPEVEACLEWSGKRPVEWLLENFAVDQRWCLIHATHLTDQEITTLANSGAVAGICPTTEANLGDGIFPTASYLQQAGVFGIGSDSQVSINPAEELRWLEYAQRLTTNGRNVLAAEAGASTGRTLFDGALAGGAQACGRNIGKLEVGCRADLVVLDSDHPRLVGRSGDDLLDSWIFGCDDNPVKDVFVGGNQVVADGVHIFEPRIEEEFKAAVVELNSSS
ncbi:formimidoylglutamate deiminase [Porticoccus sp. W117]|uniref:formimidoylglutamate deiminase n=1 Tax=Porticoccus sp. W117 TaxID=3054777 RepID=UPI00259A9BD2|nr:formimidoylglutamate deiminase [Porticoccus sp. W117]MDM3872431.1 formimidoylglutamate deiminase [Porticoccus sp. W117]